MLRLLEWRARHNHPGSRLDSCHPLASCSTFYYLFNSFVSLWSREEWIVGYLHLRLQLQLHSATPTTAAVELKRPLNHIWNDAPQIWWWWRGYSRGRLHHLPHRGRPSDLSSCYFLFLGASLLTNSLWVYPPTHVGDVRSADPPAQPSTLIVCFNCNGNTLLPVYCHHKCHKHTAQTNQTSRASSSTSSETWRRCIKFCFYRIYTFAFTSTLHYQPHCHPSSNHVNWPSICPCLVSIDKLNRPVIIYLAVCNLLSAFFSLSTPAILYQVSPVCVYLLSISVCLGLLSVCLNFHWPHHLWLYTSAPAIFNSPISSHLHLRYVSLCFFFLLLAVGNTPC